MCLCHTHTFALKPIEENTKDQLGKSPIFFFFFSLVTSPFFTKDCNK